MRRLATAVLLGALLPQQNALPAQSVNDQLVARYQRAHADELLEAGTRHVNLGLAMRKSGMVQQATYEFVRAVEVSESRLAYATKVLGLMRSLGDAFWSSKRKKTSSASIAAYKKRADALRREDRKGQVKLAKTAAKAKLPDRERVHWLAALRLGAELEITSKGAKIDGVKVSAETAEWLQGQTIAVDGKRAFDPGANKTPKLEGVVEFASDELVVRTDLGKLRAQRLHALGLALCAPLAERLEATPAQTLRLFVFARRESYDAYLAAIGHGDAVSRGLCDYGSYQTIVCAEDLEDDDLHALVLHELTHLYFFGCSPVRMPDWYAEGLAETYGGQGTFAWDGKKLTTGGPMRADRIAAVKAKPLPLRELLTGDAMQLLQTDRDAGMRYYAQCQLLQRFLLRDDSPYRARFLWWEDEVRGKLAGASTSRLGDGAPAKAAFDRLFGAQLGALEQAFVSWLAEQ